MKFPESKLAHKYLDGLIGIEIGGSAHNPFGIANCLNVDYTGDMNTIFKEEEFRLCGEKQKVDVVAPAWDLPFEDESLDYVLSSHVIEHCYDVIGTLMEWFRVLRSGGLLFIIIPHKERTFDKDRERTTIKELVERHAGPPIEFDTHSHYSVWVTEDWVEICKVFGWYLVEIQDTDDKVKNGFTVVLRKMCYTYY